MSSPTQPSDLNQRSLHFRGWDVRWDRRTEQSAVCRHIDLVQRSELSRRDLELLAGANALSTFAGNRHHAAWALAGVDTEFALLAQAAPPRGHSFTESAERGLEHPCEFQEHRTAAPPSSARPAS